MEPELSLSDEWVLIAKVKEGRRSSFDTLVSLYQHRGLSIAYTMVGNVEDAQDVLQEAFVKVYISINDFKGKAKFGTWFYRIVVNCALDFLRRRKRSAKVFIDIMADKDEGGVSPEAIDSKNEPRRESTFRRNPYRCHLASAEASANWHSIAWCNVPGGSGLCGMPRTRSQGGLAPGVSHANAYPARSSAPAQDSSGDVAGESPPRGSPWREDRQVLGVRRR